MTKSKVSDEKYKAYFEVASLFFDILKDQQGLTKFGQDELAKRYIDLKKYILLLGSDEVFNKFIQFDKNIVEYEKDKDVSKIKFWLELFVLIRKDCGNPKTKITADDILKAIMKSESEYIEMKKLINK